MGENFTTEHRIEKRIIVTGEGVSLELEPTSLLRRLLAGFYDYVLLGSIVFVACIYLLPYLESQVERNLLTRWIVIFVIILVPAFMEIITRGQSLGKMLLGIKVVRDDGGIPTRGSSVWRAVTIYFEILASLGSIALISIIFNPQGKRIGDILAGTVVVNSQIAGKPRIIQLPPELKQWVQTASLAPPPNELLESARLHLHNTYRLPTDIRHAQAVSIATELARYATPPAPTRDAERFIAAFLVARRQVEYEKLLKEEKLAKEISKKLR
ncbi:RDD family protein [Actinomycetaceae bacterium TAE3-ERU4]|nr:RDD family protein [Actinomycetaceae bacterium TAE3-ERU4]